jgi:hypothetical protein
LVRGAPQSFIQDFRSHIIHGGRRAAAEQAMSTPQTFQATLIPGSGRVAGSVTDASGAAVSAALVRAFDAAGKVVASSATDAAGAYELSGLPEGMMRIEIESPGFKKGVVQGVMASSTIPGRYDARLEVGSTTEAIEISASAAQINTSTSSVSKAGRSLGTGRGLGAGGKSGFSGVGQTNIGALPARAQAREEWRAAASGQDLGDLFEYKLKDRSRSRKTSRRWCRS